MTPFSRKCCTASTSSIAFSNAMSSGGWRFSRSPWSWVPTEVFSSRADPDLRPNRLTTTLRERRASGAPVIDLTLSNPTHAAFDYPVDLLAPLADPRALRYEPSAFGSLEARQAVAADYARQGVRVEPERIVLTASTSDAYSQLFKLLANAGDEVLVPHPSYPLFDHLTRLDLVTTRPYDLELHGAWSIDFDSVERA